MNMYSTQSPEGARRRNETVGYRMEQARLGWSYHCDKTQTFTSLANSTSHSQFYGITYVLNVFSSNTCSIQSFWVKEWK